MARFPFRAFKWCGGIVVQQWNLGAYLAAGLEVLALGVDALVVVDVVLPAVLGLVLVREAGVEASSHELEGHSHTLLVVRHVCGISRGELGLGSVGLDWLDWLCCAVLLVCDRDD